MSSQNHRRLRFTSHALNREMVSRFRAWMSLQDYLPTTIGSYCTLCEKFCAFIGRKSFAKVTPLDVADFLTRGLPPSHNPNMVNSRLAPLRKLYEFLYMGGVVSNLPPNYLHQRRIYRKLPCVLSQAQIKKLLTSTRKLRDRALLELLYATGCRMRELRTLRVSEIDFQKRCFRVKGKRKERIVFFGKEAAKALRRYLVGRKTGYLFQVEYRRQKGHIYSTGSTWVGHYSAYINGLRVLRCKYLGMVHNTSVQIARARFTRHLREINLARPTPDKPICTDTAWEIMKQAAQRIGLKFLPARMIRHSYATHLRENGADIREIQELLGHSCLSSTQIYLQVSNKSLAQKYRQTHPRG
jgi:site-specific recombinase XerD